MITKNLPLCDFTLIKIYHNLWFYVRNISTTDVSRWDWLNCPLSNRQLIIKARLSLLQYFKCNFATFEVSGKTCLPTHNAKYLFVTDTGISKHIIWFYVCKFSVKTRSPVHDAQHLFADVLGSLERADLDEVLVAPGAGELVVLPGVVHSQEGQVVALGLVELGLLLVSQVLLVLGIKAGSVSEQQGVNQNSRVWIKTSGSASKQQGVNQNSRVRIKTSGSESKQQRVNTSET